MDKPIPLDSLFKEKRFRIPDYQRCDALPRERLKALWETLSRALPWQIEPVVEASTYEGRLLGIELEPKQAAL